MQRMFTLLSEKKPYLPIFASVTHFFCVLNVNISVGQSNVQRLDTCFGGWAPTSRNKNRTYDYKLIDLSV